MLASLPGGSVRMPWPPRDLISSDALTLHPSHLLTPATAMGHPTPHHPPSLGSFLLALRGCDSSHCFTVCDTERTHTVEGNLPPISLLDFILVVLSPPVLHHACCSISQGKQKIPFKIQLNFWRSKPTELSSLQAFWKAQQIMPWSFRNQNTLRNPALNDSRLYRQSGRAEH